MEGLSVLEGNEGLHLEAAASVVFTSLVPALEPDLPRALSECSLSGRKGDEGGNCRRSQRTFSARSPLFGHQSP